MTDLRCRCHLPWLVLSVLSPLPGAAAEPIDSVNSVRAQGCAELQGGAAPLRANTRLDTLARHLSEGADQRTAAQLSGYRAARLLVISVTQVPAGAGVAQVLARQFCRQLLDPALSEIGSYRRASDVWLAIAAPFTPPAAGDLARIAARVLQLSNEARAVPRRCGADSFAAAAPLQLSPLLNGVALDYARDMAAYGYMDHTGRDGSSPAQRISRAGYRWSEVGENLARGLTTPEQLVAGWLGSPAHCANLMWPGYREAGIAFSDNPRLDSGIYWAMEFGTPR
jgi:uncharacterized protein YkwD